MIVHWKIKQNRPLHNLSFKIDDRQLKAAACTDNLYALFRSSEDATSQIELLLEHLEREWGLKPKEQSKKVFDC